MCQAGQILSSDVLCDRTQRGEWVCLWANERGKNLLTDKILGPLLNPLPYVSGSLSERNFFGTTAEEIFDVKLDAALVLRLRRAKWLPSSFELERDARHRVTFSQVTFWIHTTWCSLGSVMHVLSRAVASWGRNLTKGIPYSIWVAGLNSEFI